MKIRITLIIAILSGVAVTGFNFVTIRGKLVKLQTDLKEQTGSRLRSEAELAKTKSDLDHANAALGRSNTALEAAVAKVAEQTKRAEMLNKDLIVARQNLDEVREQLVGRNTKEKDQEMESLSGQVRNLQDNLAGVREENKFLVRRLATMGRLLDAGHPPVCPVTLPAELKANVVTVDPKWKFVVLDVGEDQGVISDGELLLSRNGRLVAKIIVQRIEKNRCIANIMPGWNLAEILEGDTAIPAHPSS